MPEPAGSGKARSEYGEVGAVYLTRDEIAARVAELGAEIARDYAGHDPILIAPLKSSVVFLADLTRQLPIAHTLDVVELAPYTGGGGGVRLLKDVDALLADRHVLVVEDVVDTGLTLHFLCRTLGLRNPASLSAVTLLDRPYRRLVDELPLRYIGFTVADELFAGYGLGLDERWRALPDLHLVVPHRLPNTATEAA
jgi:hypoxanthine phosphoribosyltransferase